MGKIQNYIFDEKIVEKLQNYIFGGKIVEIYFWLEKLWNCMVGGKNGQLYLSGKYCRINFLVENCKFSFLAELYVDSSFWKKKIYSMIMMMVVV